MARKQIDFGRITTKLNVLYSQHPADNTLSLWKKEFAELSQSIEHDESAKKTRAKADNKRYEEKRGITGKEVERLYNLFSGELQYLVGSGTKLSWNKKLANPDNWNATWLKATFEKYEIMTQFGPSLGADGKAIHPRTNYTRREEAVEDASGNTSSNLVYDELTGDFVPKGQLESPVAPEGQSYDMTGTIKNGLETFSDEELLAELQRREDERKAAAELAHKKALVQEFLTAYNMTMEDLLEIAEVI